MDQRKKGGFPLLVGVLFVGRQRSAGTPFYPLPKDLRIMDNIIFSFKRWVGLSPLGERADSWLGSPSSKKKKKQNYGRQLLYVCYGQFGRRRTYLCLKMKGFLLIG